MIMEKSKIQKFVEGLANSELTDSQQSVVLSTDAESIGAGKKFRMQKFIRRCV